MSKIKIACAIIENGSILVVRKTGTTSFISPGGKIEENETEEDCIRRELSEELGVDVISSIFYRLDFVKSVFEDELLELRTFIVDVSGMPIAGEEIEEIKWINDFQISVLDPNSAFAKLVIPALVADGYLTSKDTAETIQ